MIFTALFWVCLVAAFVSAVIGSDIKFVGLLIAAGLFAIARLLEVKIHKND